MRLSEPAFDTSRVVDVIVGLDFGTCWTKAVVRTPYERTPPKLVRLTASTGEDEWLIATACRVTGDRIELCPPGVSGATENLKLALMQAAKRNDADASGAVAVAAGYLALVLNRVRRWVTTEYERYLGRRPMKMSLRLGIPSAGYDDERMSKLFLAAGRAAYMAGLTQEPRDDRDVTLSEMCRFTEEALAGANEWANVDTSEWAGAVEVVPEVAAEAIGYARDNQSHSGLHLMIDAGASTLDICGFILQKEDRERATQRDHDLYALLTATVHDDLGVGGLLCARSPRGQLDDAQHTSRYSNAACESADAFARRMGRSVASIEKTDRDFAGRCRHAIGEVVRALTMRRDPNAPEWKVGVRVFLCGGGSHAPPYRFAIDELSRALERATGRRLELVNLPVPPVDRAQRMSLHMARRIAVAYGLSHETFEVGKIMRPSQIEDIGRKIVRMVEGEHIPFDRI